MVAEWAGAADGAVAWDLYCGVGVFAARLAGQVGAAGHVEAVEFSGRAVTDGRHALAGLRAIDFHPAKVEQTVTALRSDPQVVVLDPPRAGAGRAVIDAVARSAPARVVHVGCDPASFARDISLYLARGYRLEHVRAFDAFPLTHHVECIALLTEESST